MEFLLLKVCLLVYSFVDIDIIMFVCTAVFDIFHPLSCDVLSGLISKLNKTICVLDPFSSKLLIFVDLMSYIHAIVSILQYIVNPCLTTGDFPISCKSSIVIPLIKKAGLDREMSKKYRPVSNLSFHIQSY